MKRKYLLALILFFILACMLYHSDYVTAGARNGLLLWYHSVVPTLFPFMVLSGVIVSKGVIPVIMEPCYRILHPWFSLSHNGCYVLLTGLLCGCPMGAKTCADFVRNGKISHSEGRFLMSICNHPSPMFLLGFVYPYFSEAIRVYEFLICVYLPVFFIAFAAKQLYRMHQNPQSSEAHLERITQVNGERGTQIKDISKPYTNNQESSVSLDDAIMNSIEVLCKIGGYLVLFSILLSFIQNTSAMPSLIKYFLIGLLEMTNGVQTFVSLLPFKTAWVASVCTVTFGGLSGLFQIKSVLSLSGNEKKAGLSIRPYIFWKLTHAALSAGLAYGLYIIR